MEQTLNASCLLPKSGSTPLEKSISNVCSNIFYLELKTPLIWQPKHAPEEFLNYIEQNLNLTAFAPLLNKAEERRALAIGSLELFKTLGTPKALRFLCEKLGFGEIEILEGKAAASTIGTGAWYEYAIKIKRPQPSYRIEQLKKLVALVQPARCKLTEIQCMEPIRWNGQHRFNEEFTYGSY